MFLSVPRRSDACEPLAGCQSRCSVFSDDPSRHRLLAHWRFGCFNRSWGCQCDHQTTICSIGSDNLINLPTGGWTPFTTPFTILDALPLLGPPPQKGLGISRRSGLGSSSPPFRPPSPTQQPASSFPSQQASPPVRGRTTKPQIDSTHRARNEESRLLLPLERARSCLRSRLSSIHHQTRHGSR